MFIRACDRSQLLFKATAREHGLNSNTLHLRELDPFVKSRAPLRATFLFEVRVFVPLLLLGKVFRLEAGAIKV